MTLAHSTANAGSAAASNPSDKTEEAKSLLQAARDVLANADYTPEALQETLNHLLETTGQKPGILFSLIRLAVSWAPFSPALNETLAALGKDVTLRRLDATIGA